MYIRLADLPLGGGRFAGTAAVRLGPVDGGGEVSAPHPVAFGMWAIREGTDVNVTGWLSTTVEATCARCLEPFPRYVQRTFELVYKPSMASSEGGEVALDDRDLDLDYYQDDAIDLRALLAEQIFLTLPMKLLCRQDCRGLCPQCGTNRNQETCSCNPNVDPRLASLAAIRDQL